MKKKWNRKNSPTLNKTSRSVNPIHEIKFSTICGLCHPYLIVNEIKIASCTILFNLTYTFILSTLAIFYYLVMYFVNRVMVVYTVLKKFFVVIF